MKSSARLVVLGFAASFCALAAAPPASAQQAAIANSSAISAPATGDTSKTAATPASSNTQQVAQNNSAPDPGQPASLGDLARLARAKKQSEPKAAKVIDDENMPRGGIYIGGSAPDSTSPSSARSGGKLTLLDFWASWCGPCRDSLPDLKRFQSAFGSDQVEVVSISEDRDEHTWNNFVSQNGMTWEQRFDAQGESARRYGVNAFPTYLLVDSNGTVLQRYQGEDPSQSLLDRIGPAIKRAQEPRQPPPTS